MKLFFVIALLIVGAFALLTACENEGGSTNNAANKADSTDQQKPISPAKPVE